MATIKDDSRSILVSMRGLLKYYYNIFLYF